MKKLGIIILIIIIVFLMFCVSRESYYSHRIPDEQIILEISNLKVEDCNVSHMEYENTLEYNLPNDISNNMKKYKAISMSCRVENQSDKLELGDVRFHPHFQNELKSKVVTYNSGNGTYYIFIIPKSSAGINMYIFVESGELSIEDIYKLILDEQIEITGFTDNLLLNLFKGDKGHGWTGLGKYSYIFSIKDCLVK